jgi:hypothetical protein
MFDNLAGIAWGIVVFGVVVVIGSVVLTQFGATQATCAATYTYNTVQNKCINASGGDPTTPTGTPYTTSNYLNTQLGSSTGGLASYTPLIIISVIGFAILGMFFTGRKY